MDREQFWALIEAARAATGGNCEQQAAHLVVALRERSVSDVVDCHHIHSWLMAKSYRMELWGAAYLINGGCSDDGFDYFRGWLLSQGHATWQAALHAPDSWRHIHRCGLARRSRSGPSRFGARTCGRWPIGRTRR